MSKPDHAPRSFAGAFTSLSLAAGVSMAANLVRGKLAALFLGPAGVGVFNQLSLMWNLFQTAGSLGAFNGLVQHGTSAMVADDVAALRRLSSTWWILLTAFSCVLVVAGAFASPTISDWLLNDHGQHAWLVALMLVSVPVACSAQVYRALLSASREVSHLVRAQIASDVGGAIVFVLLVPFVGLPGAIAGFASIHLIFFVLTAISVRQTLGSDFLRPRIGEFSWRAVRSNVGYGASGLIMIALSNLSVILVSRMVIDQLGITSSGFFSNGWRIASVYLGAVTTTALAYYLPTLTRSASDEQMSSQVNAALRFYLFVMPPAMAVMMAAGEPIVWVILSPSFLPVAPLLLLFVPAELIRVIAETAAMPLLARQRLRPFTLLFATQSALFVIAAAVLLPLFGLIGAAAAYFVAMTLNAIAVMTVSRLLFGISAEGKTAWAFVRATALLAGVAGVSFSLPFGAPRLAACACGIILWGLITFRDRQLRESSIETLRNLASRRKSSQNGA